MSKKIGNKTKVFAGFLLFLALTALGSGARTVEAAGFKTIKGKTYYMNNNGKRQKGWLTLNGKKYYFDKKTGVQVKGWQKDSKGKKIRYFTKGQGVMITGWLSNSLGNVRYFSTKTGRMFKGLHKINGKYYYFSKSSGIRYQKGFGKASGKRYYFDPGDGHAHTGWLSLDGKKYYFNKKGVMYVNRTAVIDSVTYQFGKNGVAKEITDSSGQEEEEKTIKVFDEKNGKYYTVMKEYALHPGVQNGEATDLDLLAALCEAEAGDQGAYGMQAVALSLLNRTIDKKKEFPSSVRMAIYHGTSFPQYSVVTNGTLEKRLNGEFFNKKKAYAAAEAAMKIFEDYVKNGTKRTIKGFKTKDFKYKYFMMDSYFWKQPLDFDKVKYCKYKDHIFFVDWISP